MAQVIKFPEDEQKRSALAKLKALEECDASRGRIAASLGRIDVMLKELKEYVKTLDMDDTHEQKRNND